MDFNNVTQNISGFISNLSILQIIEYIGAGKFTGDTLAYAYEKIRQKHLEKLYHFSPNPKEHEEIKIIEKSDIYIRTNELLGLHPLVGLLRLGIYINQMNNEPNRKDKIQQVKDSVYKKYSKDGIRVLTLASTGQLSYILQDLNDYYQRNNYDKIKLCQVFNYILIRWKDITVFVKSEDSKNDIKIMIEEKIESQYPYFFIFSFGSASENTYLTIAELSVVDYFRQKRYLCQLRNYKEKKEDFSWVFEHLDKDIVDFMNMIPN